MTKVLEGFSGVFPYGARYVDRADVPGPQHLEHFAGPYVVFSSIDNEDSIGSHSFFLPMGWLLGYDLEHWHDPFGEEFQEIYCPASAEAGQRPGNGES